MLDWETFLQVDIRVGTVVTCSIFAKAKKPAYQLTIDFGNEIGIKKTSAQITALYEPHNLVGKQVAAVINFPPKQIANFMSECLVLGLNNPDGSVVLLQPERAVDNGERVY